MANEILIKTGTAIIVADTTDHAPAAGNDLGTRTDQIDLTSLGVGAYRQSTKLDFGVTRARSWEATGVFEFASAPTVPSVILCYIGWSSVVTAATGNPGNLSGADAAWTGYSSDADDIVSQLDFIGQFALADDAQAQLGHLTNLTGGLFVPKQRWGCLVIKNDASVSLIADAFEMSVRLSPIVDEIQ